MSRPVSFRTVLVDFFIAFLASGITAACCYPISHTIGYQTVGLIFLIVVAGLSLFLGRTALIFAALLNFAVWNYFFITPLYTFRVHNLHDLIALFANLMVALAGSTLISRIRRNQLSLVKSQERLTTLYGFLESLNNAISIKDVVVRAQELMRQYFHAEMIIYLKHKDQATLSPSPFGLKEMHNSMVWNQALSVFSNQLKAENDLPGDDPNPMLYFPLEDPRKKIGVMGVRFPKNDLPGKEKKTMLPSFATQIASALDREISIDLVKEREIYLESEKLFRTILNSVSHELKTPIAIISSAISNLEDERTSSNKASRSQLIRELGLASERLSHLVENILDMSRIESGLITLNLHPCDVSDLIGSLVTHIKHELRHHQLNVLIQEEMPFMLIDFNLFFQALINVVRNAIAYSPPNSMIRIESCKTDHGWIEIDVIDQGEGVPGHALSRLFDKFYRVPGTRPGGTGLGLTIVKAITDLHKCTISIENSPGGGMVVRFIIPPYHLEEHEKSTL